MPDSGGNAWEMGAWYDDVLVRTTQGWRINTRECHGNWWDGNLQVTETSGVPARYAMTVLKRAGAAGKVGYIEALRARSEGSGNS
jgi:hypothetical protein